MRVFIRAPEAKSNENGGGQAERGKFLFCDISHWQSSWGRQKTYGQLLCHDWLLVYFIAIVEITAPSN
jgi:hypothetical protein